MCKELKAFEGALLAKRVASRFMVSHQKTHNYEDACDALAGIYHELFRESDDSNVENYSRLERYYKRKADSTDEPNNSDMWKHKDLESEAANDAREADDPTMRSLYFELAAMHGEAAEHIRAHEFFSEE